MLIQQVLRNRRYFHSLQRFWHPQKVSKKWPQAKKRRNLLTNGKIIKLPIQPVAKKVMEFQEQYDEAMFEYSGENFDEAIETFRSILEKDPAHFDAQLGLGMAYYRKGDFTRAIEEGHRAEKLRPNEQLVHTNLSLFYMKAGEKAKAEHHGLQARIVSWKTSAPPAADQGADPELEMAKPPPPKPVMLPEMPWKKKR